MEIVLIVVMVWFALALVLGSVVGIFARVGTAEDERSEQLAALRRARTALRRRRSRAPRSLR